VSTDFHDRHDVSARPVLHLLFRGASRLVVRKALLTTLGYALVATAGFTLSDVVSFGFTGLARAELLAALLPGLGFLVVTSALLFVIVARMLAAAEERERHLSQALAETYENTLAGWTRALNLRDHETEGHSARVTELAVRLATAMGVRGEELEHIRRGAMLHDIGKLGVPDAILHKPGPLADEEWAVMRRHPEYAYSMLQPIAFLRPVLDIPYCHHERWDGSGYPRGLAGEAIPLPARIFAVVDVWDALVSDRPYRKAWSRRRVVGYLRAHAGDLFDPHVVRAFVELIEGDRERKFVAVQARRKVA
jgi:HD-GYP domain-containing protein (c-di-GMP phosphodiesterase class II)